MGQDDAPAPGSPPRRRALAWDLARRLPLAIGELAVLGAAWWFLKLDVTLVAALAGVIALSLIVPARYDSLVGGVGLLGVSALVYFHYGSTPIAAVLGVVGVVIGLGGLLRLRQGGTNGA